MTVFLIIFIAMLTSTSSLPISSTESHRFTSSGASLETTTELDRVLTEKSFPVIAVDPVTNTAKIEYEIENRALTDTTFPVTTTDPMTTVITYLGESGIGASFINAALNYSTAYAQLATTTICTWIGSLQTVANLIANFIIKFPFFPF